jgi:AraC-like DNA-binding protein
MYNIVMPSKGVICSRFSNAVIVFANYAQFNRGQKISFSRVESRMLLWCKAGTGRVAINGNRYNFEASQYWIIPWGHNIKYEASRDDPFLLGGIHIVPNHRPNRSVAYKVAHDENHPLARNPFRRDFKIQELQRPIRGFLNIQTPLSSLLDYIVRLFLKRDPEEWQARQLAQQLLSELIHAEPRGVTQHYNSNIEIERMKQFIAERINAPLSLRDLVEFSGLSPSTVGRLFREHLQTTPVTWIVRFKIERAQTLLRTRRFSIAEVGRQVGFSDSYYFSKSFKKIFGQSPREYRENSMWI